MPLFDVEVVAPGGTRSSFDGVDRISYVNQESYGPANKIGVGENPQGGDKILVINVNAIQTAEINVR
jgi:hypothetical protein